LRSTGLYHVVHGSFVSYRALLLCTGLVGVQSSFEEYMGLFCVVTALLGYTGYAGLPGAIKGFIML